MPMRELPDAQARTVITTATDRNLVVEAAAGTGKTTCLVGRLMTLFRQGALRRRERLAAVTFTHKAAAELRERLDRELVRALADDALPADERKNLAAASAALADCHIGTIHSFCARLLRERPVEAGVDPNFRELDDTDDLLLRRRAWSEFAEELAGGRHPGLYRVFDVFGLDLAALGQGFETFAEFPDVDRWPGDDRHMKDVDIAAFIAGVDAYAARLGGMQDLLDEADPGNDTLIPILRVLVRRLPRLPRPLGIVAAHRLCGLFKENPKPVLKEWLQFGLDAEGAREAVAAYARFHDETVKPFRNACLAAAYSAAIGAFRLARERYDRLRHSGGFLNFQDLLIRTAAMLRAHPGVRNDLAERYARLLVDEVQDTDPVQAEIMFLLAARRGERGDWRGRRLRPGALFMVGDPKQSIYRFRRADIQVYQEMKRIVREQGGEVLGLSANFRSDPEIIDWVNRTYFQREAEGPTPEWIAGCGRFGPEDSEYGPAYIPLLPGTDPAPADCFHGVYSLETVAVSPKKGVSNQDMLRDEAERIAVFIDHAVASGLRLPSRTGPRPAGPGDFLIVTYGKRTGRIYAEALRRRNIACQLTCGGTLADSPALGLLLPYLRALAYPDDPVLTTAVLRGGLFGVSDPQLFAWKRAGGGFTPLAPVVELDGSPLPGALGLLARHFRLFAMAPPLDALRAVLDDLGLWALAAIGDDPSSSVGVVATTLDLLAARPGGLPTLGVLVEELEWLMENYEQDPVPAMPRTGSAVRVMNLHKTKGLEAPVVFLTSTRTIRSRPPRFAVRRLARETLGELSIAGGEYDERLLAQPTDWEAMAESEALFLAAEKTRLNYVAATRAGAALVVSIHPSGKGWGSAFLPECRRGETIEKKLPEPEAPPPARETPRRTAEDIERALAEAAAERERRRAVMLAPSYRTSRAKPDGGPQRTGGEATGAAAMDRGEILHRLLAGDLPDANLFTAAFELAQEYDMPGMDVDALVDMVRAVRNSDLWKRAAAAGRVLRETPFAVRIDDGGETVLQRGVVDLAFREEGGWVIVDYKSDAVGAEDDLAAAADRHRDQLTAYADAWERITGEKVAEAGVFFIRPGVYVVVHGDA